MTRQSTASFSILYAVDWEERKGELLWRQAEGLQRWDLFYTLDDGARAGESNLITSGQPSGACSWIFESPSTARVVCTAGGVSIDFEGALITPFQVLASLMDFVGVRQILDQPVYCYRADEGLRMAAEMCMNAEGLPLSADAAFGVAGPVSLRAVAIQSQPSTTTMRELPWQGPNGTVSVTDLKLPPIPSLEAYLRSGIVAR